MRESHVFAVLPLHPPPDPGECLSGYLLRLAEINGGMRVGDLVRDLFPRWNYPHQTALLRWEYPIDDGGLLPVRTQLGRADLPRLTVAPWVAKFRAPPVVTRPGLASPAGVLRGVVRPTLQVCPLCVRDHPVIRLLWRLVAAGVCLTHACLLQGCCAGCGAPLVVIGPAERLLRCRRCGTDLRTLPVVAASEAEVAVQRRRQADLLFLLDPTTVLVVPPRPDQMVDARFLPRAMGLKFRYLRTQGGRSLAEITRQLGVRTDVIAGLERGDDPAALPLYLAYLALLGLTWSEFAALEVPAAFIQHLQELPYRALRLCPTPTCPNHSPSAGIAVRVAADLPSRQVVRFHCSACRRTFTRRYNGTLVIKPRRPCLLPGETPPIVKSAAEVARLTALGLQGLPNRQIARQLGWGERTVRMYWIALDLEGAVHAAQAQSEAQAVADRQEARRAQVAATLALLAGSAEEMSMRQISRALGCNNDYIHNDPALVGYAKDLVQRHNGQVRQHRDAVLAAGVTTALAEAQRGTEPLTVGGIARQVGLSPVRLLVSYPALHARVKAVVEADRAARREARRQRQITQINAAAARLGDEGVRLTYPSLLKAARVNRYHAFRDPAVYELLVQWIGDPAPPS